jgi:hypothetical protein
MRHKRGLLGPITVLGASEGSLLFKQMLPTQLKLRSSDTTSFQSAWDKAGIESMLPTGNADPGLIWGQSGAMFQRGIHRCIRHASSDERGRDPPLVSFCF